jgi:hypothetical protein
MPIYSPFVLAVAKTAAEPKKAAAKKGGGGKKPTAYNTFMKQGTVNLQLIDAI